jgi:Holliday junction resolvase RusA-like endonuclease
VILQTQKFIIEGNPRGQGRPRACRRGKHAGIYEAKEDTLYKQNVTAQLVTQRPNHIGPGVPIILDVAFYLSRPKSHYSAKGTIKPNYDGVRPLVKPDLDNMVKAIKDACNGIVWHDDAQVVDERVSKYYADTAPHTVIVVEVRA